MILLGNKISAGKQAFGETKKKQAVKRAPIIGESSGSSVFVRRPLLRSAVRMIDGRHDGWDSSVAVLNDQVIFEPEIDFRIRLAT